MLKRNREEGEQVRRKKGTELIVWHNRKAKTEKEM
jgi:hypothetical protein